MPEVRFSFVIRSGFPDDQVHVAVMGIAKGHVWIGPATSMVRPMSVPDDTVPGP